MELASQAAGVAAPLSGEAAAIKEKMDNVDAYKAGTTAPKLNDSGPVYKSSPKDKINPKASYGDRPGEKRIDTNAMTKPLGSFKKGTDSVPKTGTYKLHKGEAVIPAEENHMQKTMDKMKAALSAKSDDKPKKEIKEIVTSRAHDGKMIHVHKHHRPEHHPDETHVSNDMAELHKHFDDHAGTPNEGEADAGSADASNAAPAPMTAAPSPMPPPAAGPTPMAGE